jgi:hypothetical protein
MDQGFLCNLCGLNRSTLHLDEMVEGTIQATAHLCDDCWYRLGIRIPLGNIWNHIQRCKQDFERAASPPLEDVEEILKAGDGLGDLRDPGSLAVAEPDDERAPPPDDIEEPHIAEKQISPRGGDLVDLESFLEDVSDGKDILRKSKPLGIPAVTIERIHPTLVSLFPFEMLTRHRAIPIRLEGTKLTVALADPFDKIASANLEVHAEKMGLSFARAIADELEILRELERHNDPRHGFESLS